MTTYTGIIASVDKRAVTVKRGPRAGNTAFVTILKMADGQEFDWGFGKLPAEMGDTVTFEWSAAFGKQQIDQKSFTRGGAISSALGLTGVTPPPVAKSYQDPKRPYPSTSSGGNPRQFPVPLLHGDRSIVRQNALAHAARLVSTGIVPLPTAAAVTPDDIATLTIALARKFEHYSCGDDEREAAEAILKKNPEAPTDAE